MNNIIFWYTSSPAATEMMCGVKLCPTLPNPAKGANFEAGAEAGRVGENWPTSATGLTVAVRTFLGWAASWARRAAAASSGVAYFRGRPLFFAAELERAPLTGGGGGDDELRGGGGGGGG